MALACDKSPVLLGKDCPAIPPGLEVDPTIGNNSLVPPLLSTQVQPENNSSTAGVIFELLTPQQRSSDPTPATPTSFGRQIFNTIRRAPSMPATRANANSTDGNDRKSLADKSPRPPPSPSAFAAVPESSHEIPPPVPPLPPSILATQPPSTLPHLNEPRKEEKAKEKSRSGANWFSKKRKSLKLGDKIIKQEDPSPQTPPSLVIPADDLGHSHATGRFNRTQSSSSTPKSQWPLPEVDPDMSRKILDRRPNGYDDSHSQPSGSSSPSTTSLFVSGQGAVGGSTSTSSTPHHDHLRNSSVTAPSERSRVSVDRDKSLDFKIPLHGGPSATSSTQNNLDHPLPPVPSPTRHLNKQSFSGHSHTEHDAMSTYRTESDTWLLDQQSFLTPPHVSRSSTLPPHPSLSITVGSNTSGDSTPAMGRHPIRKLSITTPILGFGKKDREKNKR